jgi:fructose-bisphosphate aldolase class II
VAQHQSAQTWFFKAQTEGFAIGAFNVANFETFKAVVAAAVAEASPVMIESSDGETAYVGADNLVDLVANAREETGLPIFLNLDHSRNFDKVTIGIEAGYDLVHYDGSKEAVEVNLQILKKVIPLAHQKNVLVEGEMDYIIEGSEVRGLSAAEGRAQSHLTDPEAAAAFVQASGLDTFAVSIGNVHGLYTTPKELDFERLAAIRKKITCFLSLHGGSGISDDQIRRAIALGRIVKINISTELRQALRQGLEEGLVTHPSEVAMYKITPKAITAVQNVVVKKMRLFGSAGKASQ